nr:succinyl-CoA ligase subunit beta [Raoultella sp. NCTC 9187]
MLKPYWLTSSAVSCVCDLIADGIIGAVEEVGVNVPVVVRLEGNNAELGAKKLADSGLNIIAAKSLTDAAQQVVCCSGGGNNVHFN